MTIKPQISRKIRQTAFFACAAMVIPGSGLASPLQAGSPQQPAAQPPPSTKAAPAGTVAAAGATAVIQPGGSVRDQEVIDAANRLDLAMVFTGMRHFLH